MVKKFASLVMGIGLVLAAQSLPAADKASKQILAEADRFAAAMSEPLRPFYRKLYVEGEWNAVLNFDYLGLAAMSVGDYSAAEHAFDAAITRIEAIYANDPNAKKAKSLYNEEKVKDFKGEPYERSMAYYYRGILYLRAGDYQNARAMFLSAERHDSFSEQEEFQSDFGLMNYLAAWASHCDGDEERAADLYALAVKADAPRFEGMAYSYPFIGLIDGGLSPIKIGQGKYKEQLKMVASDQSFSIVSASASVPLITPDVREAADIAFQATTRGGRPVEAILKGKAQFKDVTGTVSNVAGQVGVNLALQGAYSGDSDIANAGLAGLGVSLISGVFSAATTPAADTRYWGTLPASVYITLADTLPPDTLQLTFNYAPVSAPDVSQPGAILLEARNGQCGIAWGRTHSALPAAAITDPIVKETNRTERNRSFRALLESTFVPASDAVATVAEETAR